MAVLGGEAIRWYASASISIIEDSACVQCVMIPRYDCKSACSDPRIYFREIAAPVCRILSVITQVTKS